jgi:hypothetical protein
MGPVGIGKKGAVNPRVISVKSIYCGTFQSVAAYLNNG